MAPRAETIQKYFEMIWEAPGHLLPMSKVAQPIRFVMAQRGMIDFVDWPHKKRGTAITPLKTIQEVYPESRLAHKGKVDALTAENEALKLKIKELENIITGFALDEEKDRQEHAEMWRQHDDKVIKDIKSGVYDWSLSQGENPPWWEAASDRVKQVWEDRKAGRHGDGESARDKAKRQIEKLIATCEGKGDENESRAAGNKAVKLIQRHELYGMYEGFLEMFAPEAFPDEPAPKRTAKPATQPVPPIPPAPPKPEPPGMNRQQRKAWQAQEKKRQAQIKKTRENPENQFLTEIMYGTFDQETEQGIRERIREAGFSSNEEDLVEQWHLRLKRA